MDSLPVETKGSVNLILQEVSVDAEQWVKFVICPVYAQAVAPKKTLFVIYEAIRREGTFNPLVLFFYILSELDMGGIAVELAKLVTNCDTVRAEGLFSSVRPNDRNLKKLRLLSLRLALAKVFYILESTDTEVENLKAALGYPSGDRNFCYILKALESSKKVSYDDYRVIGTALESCKCSTYNENLTDFLQKDNPFLGKECNIQCLFSANMAVLLSYSFSQWPSEAEPDPSSRRKSRQSQLSASISTTFFATAGLSTGAPNANIDAPF